LTASEAWPVLVGSLEQTVEQYGTGSCLTGMSSQDCRERHLLTLVMMPGLGLFRLYDLNTYTGTALGLLTERYRPYSTDDMEHFVLSCVRIGWTEPLSAAVAAWATQLWATNDPSESAAPTYLYWDWHVKAVYSGYRLPRTKHGTSDRIVGARKQLMLHDAAGHLLLMRTYRGDTHLIDGMVDGTAYYEGLAESRRLTHQIFDREGLSVAYFKDLLEGEERRQFITCLKSNQYESVDSFELCSSFAPFRHDKHGQVVQEIAEASYILKDRRAGEGGLPLRAILLRKPGVETDDQADDKARLHVVITSDRETPAADIAAKYRERYPKQENAIRDWWLPLGGDVNVGYDKREVENSELAKRKVEMEARLESLKRHITACHARLQSAQRQHQKRAARYQAEWQAARQSLQEAIRQRDAQGDTALAIYQWAQAEETRIREQMEPRRARVKAAAERIEKEQGKQQRYYEEQWKEKQALSVVTQKMADCPMYELDDRKDQLLSALRLCLGNALQWLRDTVFPDSYGNATYKTLAPFVQMGGFVIKHPDCIEVILDGFWQSAKQRDLAVVVERCNAQSFTAPDGRPLWFSICPAPGHI
jgi:hypothetical protein